MIGGLLLACTPLLHAKNGEHRGELKQLAGSINFSLASGQTVTDANGTHYMYHGITTHDNKVYPPEYWGTYPLYFFGRPVGVRVDLANTGPRNTIKLKVVTEVYILMTDGSNGGQLAPTKEVEVVLKKGERRSIDATFTAQATSSSDSGLDRFVVKVLHVNRGGGPGNAEPGLIMVKEGIFCPPGLME
jgi:hypothetical protein